MCVRERERGSLICGCLFMFVFHINIWREREPPKEPLFFFQGNSFDIYQTWPLLSIKQAMNNTSNEDEEIIRWFDEIALEAGSVQTKTLQRILELNFGVEYLKKWLGDLNIEDIEPRALESLYTSLVPLVSHADLEPYIQRIADGDPSPLLTQEPITILSLRLLLISSFLFSPLC